MGCSRKGHGQVSSGLVELEVPEGHPSGGAMREFRDNVNCGCHWLSGSSSGMSIDKNGEGSFFCFSSVQCSSLPSFSSILTLPRHVLFLVSESSGADGIVSLTIYMKVSMI